MSKFERKTLKSPIIYRELKIHYDLLKIYRILSKFNEKRLLSEEFGSNEKKIDIIVDTERKS